MEIRKWRVVCYVNQFLARLAEKTWLTWDSV